MNLAALQAAVQAKGYGTDTVAFQTQFINETYRTVCGSQRWTFLEKQDSTLVTVVGTEGYTLPMTDWRSIDAVRISIPAAQQYNDLDYKSTQEFRDLVHLDRSTDTPSCWTYINQQLHFYPIPDNTYKVYIDYCYEPPDLAAAGDIPVIPVQYHDVLVWGGVDGMTFRERDWIGQNAAMTRVQQLTKAMAEEYAINQRQTGSHVKATRGKNPNLPYPFMQTGF